MNINDFCVPALLYIAFSLTHIIIDTAKHMYNTALLKFFIMIIFTFLLNTMCQRGLGIISWFIVFIPFITMTVITTLLLVVFGLSPSRGQASKNFPPNGYAPNVPPNGYAPHNDRNYDNDRDNDRDNDNDRHNEKDRHNEHERRNEKDRRNENTRRNENERRRN